MIIIQKNFTGGNNRSTKYQVFGNDENLPQSTHNQSVAKPASSTNSSGDDWNPDYSNQELDPHKQVLDFVNKSMTKAEEERRIAEQQKALSPQKAYERTAIGAVNPADKDKMIMANHIHTAEEAGQKALDILKGNNWKFNYSPEKEITSETETSNDSNQVSTGNNTTGQSAEYKTEIKHTPKKDHPAVEYKPEENESQEPVDANKGLSGGAKAGLAVAGAAALTAGGYAAYKALKKRAAKKKAEKAEVDKFLNEKYNTK